MRHPKVRVKLVYAERMSRRHARAIFYAFFFNDTATTEIYTSVNTLSLTTLFRSLADGVGATLGLERGLELPHLAVVESDHPVGVAEPPALGGPLEQRDRLATVLEARVRLAREHALDRQERIRLAHRRLVAALRGFGDRAPSVLGRPLVLSEEAVRAAHEEVIAAGERAVALAIDALLVRKEQVEHLLY